MYNYFVAFDCLGQNSGIPEPQPKILYFCAPFEKMEKTIDEPSFVETFQETSLPTEKTKFGNCKIIWQNIRMKTL